MLELFTPLVFALSFGEKGRRGMCPLNSSLKMWSLIAMMDGDSAWLTPSIRRFTSNANISSSWKNDDEE